MFQISIVASGSGEEFIIGTAGHLHDATRLVEDCERQFSEWEAEGFPDTAILWLQNFEGCDVYARSIDSDELFVLDDSWEIVS